MNYNKLKWRSRRSLLELDIIFDNFIKNNGFEELNQSELVAYSKILELEDWYLLLLCQGKEKLIDELMQQVLNKILEKSIG